MSYPTYENTYSKEIAVGDKVIKVEIGKFSQQTAAAVLVSCGETVVHTTIALGRKVDLGYFPLSLEFSEKLYAGGIIKGSRWVKRDGKPTDEAILKARVIDRTLRPLFPEGIRNEVQIVNTVFSYDGENDPDMLGMIGSSLGLTISQIPFDGPVAGLRIGYSKETQQFIINPTNTQRETSDLDLVVSGSDKAVVMVEAGANEISEDKMLEAFSLAQETLGQICSEFENIAKEIGKEKIVLVDENSETDIADELIEKVYSNFNKQIQQAVEKKAHLQDPQLDDLIDQIHNTLNKGKTEDDESFVTAKEIDGLVYKLMKRKAREMILQDEIRPDGRKLDEIRSIWCEVDIFPRNHGSAMFKRGATQAVTITTLGSPSLGQYVEDMEGMNIHRYLHHYNMPPFASGEAGRIGWPKRREIGHGALAQRALMPMIPSQEEFPYTIHVVSEILSSNGSTSQAAICGSTMSLMSAGVPIKRPVAGIAMGLMTDGDKYVVLSDIQGLEDHIGDMDFKVAGTQEGITALQMDIKIKGIPSEIMTQALQKAKLGRAHILSKMLETIAEPRTQLSSYAPKIAQVVVPVDKIGEIIGPGGKNIKAIIEQTGAEIDIEEDEEKKVGVANITSPDQEKIDAAVQTINNIIRVIEVGDEFEGNVTRIENYGAFVEYLPGREGLVHVSRMSDQFVQDPNTIASLGDKVYVRVAEIKDDGKIGLSMLTVEQEQQAAQNRDSKPRFRGGRSGDNRRDDNYRNRPRR